MGDKNPCLISQTRCRVMRKQIEKYLQIYNVYNTKILTYRINIIAMVHKITLSQVNGDLQ